MINRDRSCIQENYPEVYNARMDKAIDVCDMEAPMVISFFMCFTCVIMGGSDVTLSTHGRDADLRGLCY